MVKGGGGSFSGLHLQKGLFLLHVFVNERHELLWLSLSTPTPVLLPAVLLLQTLEDATHLERQTVGVQAGRQVCRPGDRPTGGTCWDVL